jgi:Helix-turn-helix domain
MVAEFKKGKAHMSKRTHALAQAEREERTPARAATSKQTKVAPKQRRAVNITDWRERAFVSVPQTAAILGIGRSMAWELVYAGELPSRKCNTSRRVPVAALLALEAESARRGGAGDDAA